MAATSSSFADLIAPLAPADIAALWRRRELKLQRGAGENRFKGLLDWNGFWKLIEDRTLPAENCRVTFGRRRVPTHFYLDEDKLNPGKLARLFDQGTSLIVVNIDPYVPALTATFRDAERHGVRIVEAGAIVTTGAGGAMLTHYDLHDLIILQIEGSKQWRIYAPRVLEPAKELGKKNPPRTPPILDIILQEGDILFLPAGFWHVCDNGSNRSFHIDLFLNAPQADPQ